MKTSDVAKRLDISGKTVRRLASEGVIPCRVIPGRKKFYIFDRKSIEEFAGGRQTVETKYEINLHG